VEEGEVVCPIPLGIGVSFQCQFLVHPNSRYWILPMPIPNFGLQYLHPNGVQGILASTPKLLCKNSQKDNC
jgi:hypothetical protein